MKIERDNDGIHTPIRLRGIYQFDQNNPVNKLDQFVKHTTKHIENVKTLGSYFFDKIKTMVEEDPSLKEDFNIPKNASLDNLSNNFDQMIANHDIAKMANSPKFLAKHGFSEPMYKTLAGWAGVEFDKENLEISAKLTDADKLEMKVLGQNLGLDKWERDLFALIEESADLADRGCNPISSVEMDKKTKLGSAFGISVKQDVWQKLMLDAEVHYDKNMLPEQLKFAENLLNKSDDPRQAKNKKIAYSGASNDDFLDLKEESSPSYENTESKQNNKLKSGCPEKDDLFSELESATAVSPRSKKIEDLENKRDGSRIGSPK